MLPIVTAAEMRALDAETIDRIGLPGAVLMETAGRRVAEEILSLLGARTVGAHVAVVCGTGNNGGDGFVCARVLGDAGVDAVVYLVGAREAVRGDAALHLGVFERAGGHVVPLADARALATYRAHIDRAHVVVDALFGTGLSRPIEGHQAEVIEVISGARGAVLSVDVPSGLHADHGEVLGACVQPDVTVTMAFLKPALALSPGFARAGRVEIAEIGIPRQLAATSELWLLEEADVRALAPRPSPLDHKGRRGHALVVAGWPGKRGAGRLAALAALRAGAGLSTLAASTADDAVADPVMTAALGTGAAAAGALRDLAAGKAALAIGPGLDPGDDGAELVRESLSLGVPVVLDADALNHLAGSIGLAAVRAAPRAILTPHPGEAARLLSTTVAEIEADRVGAARRLAAESGAVVVLKGARTLVCSGRFVTVNPTGSPALATAGTGDVLTGALAALLAQGLEAADAARLGVWIHGAAGQRAEARLGALGVTASDVRAELPGALAPLCA